MKKKSFDLTFSFVMREKMSSFLLFRKPYVEWKLLAPFTQDWQWNCITYINLGIFVQSCLVESDTDNSMAEGLFPNAIKPNLCENRDPLAFVKCGRCLFKLQFWYTFVPPKWVALSKVKTMHSSHVNSPFSLSLSSSCGQWCHAHSLMGTHWNISAWRTVDCLCSVPYTKQWRINPKGEGRNHHRVGFHFQYS